MMRILDRALALSHSSLKHPLVAQSSPNVTASDWIVRDRNNAHFRSFRFLVWAVNVKLFPTSGFSLCCYACINFFSKIHLMQQYKTAAACSPGAERKGDLVHCGGENPTSIFRHCAPTVLRQIYRGTVSLMKITFTPVPLLPIQPTLCNRWALGPGCLSLIAFLKQDQTGSVGGVLAVMWIWWVQQ